MAGNVKLTCSEDSVEYRLFPGTIHESIDSYLEDFRQQIFIQLNSLLTEYIWQNEPFNLRLIPCTNTAQAHLLGSTKFGDNVEDEWCIVFLMVWLTKAFPDLVVQINDNDGEFLLIETADFLPGWLEPETAENRVFLHDGKLHIIPMPTNPVELTILPSGTPSLDAAVACVRQYPHLTLASADIQQALQRRIKGVAAAILSAILYLTLRCYESTTAILSYCQPS